MNAFNFGIEEHFFSIFLTRMQFFTLKMLIFFKFIAKKYLDFANFQTRPEILPLKMWFSKLAGQSTYYNTVCSLSRGSILTNFLKIRSSVNIWQWESWRTWSFSSFLNHFETLRTPLDSQISPESPKLAPSSILAQPRIIFSLHLALDRHQLHYCQRYPPGTPTGVKNLKLHPNCLAHPHRAVTSPRLTTSSYT